MFAHVLSSPNDDGSQHLSIFALLFDIGNKLIGSLNGLIHIFDQAVNFSLCDPYYHLSLNDQYRFFAFSYDIF